MAETINWRALRAEGQAHTEKQIAEAAAKNSVSRDFYGAALVAMRSAQQDELYPAIGEYGETVTPLNKVSRPRATLART